MTQDLLSHRGKWLKEQVRAKGFLLKEIAIVTVTHASNLTRDFARADMPFTRMAPICEYIGIDLLEFYPEAQKKLQIRPEKLKNWEEKFYKASKKLSNLRELHDKTRRELLKYKKENTELKKKIASLEKGNKD